MKQINASQLYSYLNDLFPQSSAAEWDKVGFQIPEVFGTPQQDKLQNVVICLDVTSEVVEYAIEKKSNLIISRHPFIFNEIDLEKKDESKKTNYQKTGCQRHSSFFPFILIMMRQINNRCWI
jgi:putative NIF3 family GTP cyclohydrolase 1 type 2